MSDLHHEKHLEAYIVQKLSAQGWLVGRPQPIEQVLNA